MKHALIHAWEKVLHQRRGDRAIVQAIDSAACSFSELDARADAWLATHASAHAGQLAGRAVVFAQPNGIGWFEGLLALWRAGAVAVPLDPHEPPSARLRIAEELRAGFWWDGKSLTPLAKPRRFRAAEITLIKLTSGTTGRPRPLIFTAEQLLADARQVIATMGIGRRDLNYALIPLGHSYGLGNLTIPLLAHGVPLVCSSGSLPYEIGADLARWQPTVFPGVPAVFRGLALAGVEPKELRSLRLAISAGAPLPPETARDFTARFGLKLHNFYGASETGGIAYDRSGTATLSGSVGMPLRGVRLKKIRGQRIIVTSAAVGTHGRRVRGGAHGSWTPPDRISIDARGRLTLLGRSGATVKIAGRRVNLAEISARLRRLAGVRDAWVAVSADAEPRLGAVLATSRPLAELRAELVADFAVWKVPKKWALVSDFPLTPRGKTDTRALRALLGW